MARQMSMPRGAKGGKGGPRPKAKKGTLPRLLKMLFSLNKWYLIAAGICLLLASVTGVANSIFLEKILFLIEEGVRTDRSVVWGKLLTIFAVMGSVYATCIISFAAFSTSSFTTLAILSTTSPAAILLDNISSITFIIAILPPTSLYNIFLSKNIDIF